MNILEVFRELFASIYPSSISWELIVCTWKFKYSGSRLIGQLGYVQMTAVNRVITGFSVKPLLSIVA